MANEKIINLNNLKDFRQKNDQRYEEGKVEVGIAKQLKNISEESGSTQTAPFVFQATGTDDNTTETPTAPIAKHLQLRGNSVAWNQLVDAKDLYEHTQKGITFSKDVSNQTITLDGTCDTAFSDNGLWLVSTLVANHIGLYRITLISGSITLNGGSYKLYQRYASDSGLSYPTTIGQQLSALVPSSNSNRDIAFTCSVGVAFTNAVFKLETFDLTQLGKEYSSVLEFNRDYPLPFYSYNAGQLLSCKASKLITVGYNQFDGELENGGIDTTTGQNTENGSLIRTTNYIPVISGQSYTVEANIATYNAIRIFEYDGNHNLISTNVGFTSLIKYVLSTNTKYVRFIFATGTIPSNPQICFHLTWDESRTGYAPYEKHEYNLPSIELRSAGSVYDEITPDGKHTTRIGSYTFTGSESWSVFGSSGAYVCSQITGVKQVSGSSDTGNIRGNDLIATSQYHAEHGTYTNSIAVRAGQNNTVVVYLNSSITSGSAMASAMAGKTIFFELATPIEEQVSSFTENIIVDDFGTMEFVSAFTESASNPIVPQGNQFFYPADYVLLIDDLNTYVDGDITNLAKKSDLTASESDRDAVDNALKENIGGTLRHMISGVDFNNTALVDLGSLTYTKTTGSTSSDIYFYAQYSSAKGGENNGLANAICSTLQTTTPNGNYNRTLGQQLGIAINPSSFIMIAGTQFDNMSASEFKNAMTGILLAYEKAS